MAANFISATEGLEADHLKETPLMETVYCLPDAPGCETSRLYSDGAYYFYSEQYKTWAYFSDVKPEGIDKLKAIFESCCDITADPPQSGNAEGSFTYRFRGASCQREVTIAGMSYGPYRKLNEISDVINGNLKPVVSPSK